MVTGSWYVEWMDRSHCKFLLAEGAALRDLDGFLYALQAKNVPTRRGSDTLHLPQANCALHVKTSPFFLCISVGGGRSGGGGSGGGGVCVGSVCSGRG